MARDDLLRAAQRKTAIGPSDLGGFAERLLLQLPMFLTVAFGLIFIVGRFIALLKEDLKDPPDNLASVALLAMMVVAAAVMVTLVCTAAGAVIGLVLRACFGKRLHRALNRHYSFSKPLGFQVPNPR
jgi:predicted branched-subunit amino acid permease